MTTRLVRSALSWTIAATFGLSAGAWAAEMQPTADNMAPVQQLGFNDSSEPNTIDPALADTVEEATLISMNFEGLLRVESNEQGAAVAKPGVAQSWDVSKDGLTWTFHLRDAKFSNGDPVNAQAFVYSLKRAIDPQTASPYSYQLYYIKNAAAINSGKVGTDTLGAKALDDRTLQIQLENPTPYFQFIAGFQTLVPVDPAVVEAHPKDWTQSGDTYVGNGPFKMVKWIHNQEIDFVKNPNYWDAASVHLDSIKVTLVGEPMTEYNMFKTNQIQVTDSTPGQLNALLKKDPTYHVKPWLGTYFYALNNKVKPLDDVRVRQALSLAIDRTVITDKILKQGQIPAAAMVPPGLADADGNDFRTNGGDFYPVAGDVGKAKQLLAEAGYPGGQGFPAITLTYNSNSTHKLIAEAIQQMWKKNLGVNIQIREVEGKVWSQMLNARGGYDVMREGWIGDYPDPMTFLDMWETNSGQNTANLASEAYDKAIDEAKSTGDQAVRMKDMHQAEAILVNQAAIAPIYFYVRTWMQSPTVQGVDHLITGNVDFKHAWISN